MKRTAVFVIAVILSAFLLPVGILADENNNHTGSRRSPFLTFEENQKVSEFGNASDIDYLALSAIFYSRTGSVAIIDGKVLREGDIVDNKEIVEIMPEAVILKDAQNEYIIKIKGILEKGES